MTTVLTRRVRLTTMTSKWNVGKPCADVYRPSIALWRVSSTPTADV